MTSTDKLDDQLQGQNSHSFNSFFEKVENKLKKNSDSEKFRFLILYILHTTPRERSRSNGIVFSSLATLPLNRW